MYSHVHACGVMEWTCIDMYMHVVSWSGHVHACGVMEWTCTCMWCHGVDMYMHVVSWSHTCCCIDDWYADGWSSTFLSSQIDFTQKVFPITSQKQ